MQRISPTGRTRLCWCDPEPCRTKAVKAWSMAAYRLIQAGEQRVFLDLACLLDGLL